MNLKRFLDRKLTFFRAAAHAEESAANSDRCCRAPADLFVPALEYDLLLEPVYGRSDLHIYSYQLEGGKTPNRDDLREINSLNHYIGMRPLLESDFSEFTWIPLVVGLLIILALRAMVIGKMSNLVDVFVMFVYFGAFSMWSFYHRLYMYAHNLDPTASIKVQPFTPPFFGSKQIANFTVNSLSRACARTAFFAFAILLLVAILLSARLVNPRTRRPR